MVRASKVLKVELDGYGSYLGRAEGCFEVRDKNGKVERYPHFENKIGEAVLKSGSYVSVDALIDLALWNIDTYIMTRRNRVVAVLRNMEDDNHVETRIAQYEALTNGKGTEIAKQLVLSKIEGSQRVLRKYNLEPLDVDIVHRQIRAISSTELKAFRRRLIAIEAKCARMYFDRIFSLFPENIRPENRRSRKAYDGINNVFNFGYYVLKCRVHKALIKAKLEPYLGFLHALKDSTLSLVCDFMEPYRYLVDDLLIERCQKYKKKDFVAVTDFSARALNPEIRERIRACGDRPSEFDPYTVWGLYNLHDFQLLEPYHFALEAITKLTAFVDRYLELLGCPSFIEIAKTRGDDFANTLNQFERGHLGF